MQDLPLFSPSSPPALVYIYTFRVSPCMYNKQLLISLYTQGNVYNCVCVYIYIYTHCIHKRYKLVYSLLHHAFSLYIFYSLIELLHPFILYKGKIHFSCNFLKDHKSNTIPSEYLQDSPTNISLWGTIMIR